MNHIDDHCDEIILPFVENLLKSEKVETLRKVQKSDLRHYLCQKAKEFKLSLFPCRQWEAFIKGGQDRGSLQDSDSRDRVISWGLLQFICMGDNTVQVVEILFQRRIHILYPPNKTVSITCTQGGLQSLDPLRTGVA